jgi:hypothetical protein
LRIGYQHKRLRCFLILASRVIDVFAALLSISSNAVIKQTIQTPQTFKAAAMFTPVVAILE